VDYRVLSQRQETLTVRLYGGRAREWEKVSIDDGAIRSVEVDPHARTTDLTVILSTAAAEPNVYLDESPRALIIEVARGEGPPNTKKQGIEKKVSKKKTIASKETAPSILVAPVLPRPRVDIDAPYLALSPLRTIVIDPGHGGKDVGAVGPNGTLEKDANLQIGLALAKLLNEEGRFKVILSTALVFEYEDVLKRRKKELRLNDEEIETILDNLCLQGFFKKVHFLWRPQLRDPKDDHILELAVAGNGMPIVTYNKSDFEGAKSFGIRVLSPKQFWEEFL
jgi:predicted nucleic acid-binding protein